MPKTCHVAVSKPNTNSLWSLGTYHGKASGTPSQAAAEGFDVQRPWKGAAGVLRLLRGAQNVPRSSFEAQYKQLVGPREVPWQSKRDAFESCCGGFCGPKAFESCCGVLRLLRGAQNVPRSSFEAQRKRLVRPREYHGKAGGPKACHVAASKPNANSLWGLGRYHGKGQSRHRALPHTYGDPGRRPA